MLNVMHTEFHIYSTKFYILNNSYSFLYLFGLIKMQYEIKHRHASTVISYQNNYISYKLLPSYFQATFIPVFKPLSYLNARYRISCKSFYILIAFFTLSYSTSFVRVRATQLLETFPNIVLTSKQEKEQKKSKRNNGENKTIRIRITKRKNKENKRKKKKHEH